MDIEGTSGEILDGNEEHVIGTWKKSDPCYKVAKNFTELYPAILQKVKLVTNTLVIKQRRFPSKVLQPGSSLPLTVKCEREEIN